MRVRAKVFAVVSLAAALAAGSARSDCSFTSVGTTPLNDAGPRFYKNFQCGLYPRGGDSRPPALNAAALALGGQIQPLDVNGNPNATGRIVMMSIGMSNTTQEFGSAGSGAFKPRADADPSKNPRLVIVDGAQGGQDATDWVDPNAATWSTADSRLAAASATPKQVQVIWLKQALANPNNYGAFPAHAQALQNDLAIIARNVRARYPNAKLFYLSSRTRAYTNVATQLNPEPFAFEGGFSTKWVIEDQIAGRNNLNWDAAKGAVVAPLILWGPYLWADGTTPRSDGFTWLCSDLQNDYTHPSPTGGVPKVATELLAFFKTDPSATPWFLNPAVVGQPPVVTAAANVTSGNAPLIVNFTSSASDPDGSIASYQWTFDDGTFSTAQNPAKIFTAPGNYRAHLTVTDNSGNTAQRTISITVNSTLDQWRRIYFTAAELNDPQISGDLADADGDGMTTLAEYALGTNPKAADTPVFTTQSAAGMHLTLTFPRAKFAAEVSITFEVANDPAGPWSSGAAATSEQVIADDGVVQTVVSTDLTANAARRFMRLRIDKLAGANSARAARKPAAP
ncbi:MAG: PKD domain-containing protein [Verrucomicrobiota bacterium]|nr:PKD domain-containing protein [Verrucomicrobiota bacterium]